MIPEKVHTLHKWRIHRKFRSVCKKYKVHLSHEVRITDLIAAAGKHLPIEDYRFLLHSRFNYSIASFDTTPLFLVDFSNPIHYREKCRRNDEILDSLRSRFDLPLLRINAAPLFQHIEHLQLISRLVEIWFDGGAFQGKWDRKQRNRPKHAKVADQNHDSLSIPSELRMINISRETGTPRHTDLSLFLGTDRKKILHGIGWLRVSEENGILAHAAIRNHGFPISEAGLLTEILRFQAFEKLYTCYTGTGRPVPMETIEKSVRLFKERLAPLTSPPLSFRRPADGNPSSDSC